MTQNVRRWIRESVTSKLIIISTLTLLLLIPGSMIRNLVLEREGTRDQVLADIHDSWGNRQGITGPVITVPYTFFVVDEDKRHKVTRHIHLLPDELIIEGQVDPEIRYRSIYKVVVYNGKLSLSGSFDNLDLSSFGLDPTNIHWDRCIVSMGISDLRGIRKELKMKLNGKEYELNPGIPVKDIISSGVSFKTALDPGKAFNFSMELDLNGSEALDFIPMGKTTRVKLHSPWTTPSFTGAYLPKPRTVTEEGFQAEWTILHLNRNYPQEWIGSQYEVKESSFGVGLLMPVDQYQKTHRAVKYALMFIGLTFLIFFFSEVLNRTRIHPIQYLLVGLSLVIFFTLLLALAEHMGFGLAYLLSAGSTILIITLYYQSVLRKAKASMVIGLLLSVLYVFLYVTLQMEDYALLMGSIGLFAALALVMFISRKMDWYEPLSFKSSIKTKDR